MKNIRYVVAISWDPEAIVILEGDRLLYKGELPKINKNIEKEVCPYKLRELMKPYPKEKTLIKHYRPILYDLITLRKSGEQATLRKGISIGKTIATLEILGYDIKIKNEIEIEKKFFNKNQLLNLKRRDYEEILEHFFPGQVWTIPERIKPVCLQAAMLALHTAIKTWGTKRSAWK